ncbi:MAG: RNA-binding protein [Proteobacteria bacterium]|nr:RNA-binding protein [Pseudomonadota bacterium]
MAEEDEPETGPVRRCIVTRERLPKEAMIRFVVGPDRAIVPDLAARLPGRGIWLSARDDVLETARAKGGFARAARGPVKVQADLTAIVRTGLQRRIIELLGLARRAGQAVAGFEKARTMLRAGNAGLVVQAADGSPEERNRLLSGVAGGPRVIAPLDGAALGEAFGRDRAVHVAVAAGRLADALVIEAARLAGVSGLTDKAAGSDAGQTLPGNRADNRTGA